MLVFRQARFLDNSMSNNSIEAFTKDGGRIYTSKFVFAMYSVRFSVDTGLI